MADTPLFPLNDRHRLAYDGNQWIIQRRSGKPRQRTSGWTGIAFVAHKKSTLWRLLRLKEILITDLAVKHLDALPDTFEDFLWKHDPDAYRRNPALIRRQGDLRPAPVRSLVPDGSCASEGENAPHEPNMGTPLSAPRRSDSKPPVCA